MAATAQILSQGALAATLPADLPQANVAAHAPRSLIVNTEIHDSIDSGNRDLSFDDIPPFPDDVPTAPLLRISLKKLLDGDQQEVDRLWTACCELGFVYLDLRGGKTSLPAAEALSPKEHHDLTANPWDSEMPTAETVTNHSTSQSVVGVEVNGDKLVEDAYRLFGVGEELFDLPLAEKSTYDLSAEGSYFGYKGYGKGQTDAKGTPDRNEFFNVSKDDILGISEPIPKPSVLEEYKPLLASYMQQSHAVVSLLLRLLNARLDLPQETLPSCHRLRASSGDQVRWVKSPPQPQNDRQKALGEHSDFGSVTVLFNRLGGLQVLPPGQESDWCYVKPLKGHAVVNLGDAMVKFSAGLLRSSVHRVVNPPGLQADSTRMSLVYFARPEDDVILKALDGSRLIDEQKAQGFDHDEEEITSKDWIRRRALGTRQGGSWTASRGTEKST